MAICTAQVVCTAVSPPIWVRHIGCELHETTTEFSRWRKESDMFFANVLMLALFYVVLVIPILWLLQPVRLVTPY